MTRSPEADEFRAGVVYAVLAYASWGLAPAYWKQLAALPPLEILAHRVVWSALVAAVALAATGLWRSARATLREGRVALVLGLSAAIIGGNWCLFIWAVNHDRIVDTSLGYFLTPLLNVALGMGVLGERLGRMQLAAVALAALGVGRLAFDLGALPWVSLALGGSFAVYGLLRKLAPVPSLVGLATETAILAPLGAAWLAWLSWSGAGTMGGDGPLPGRTAALLVGAGAMTAGPLLWFASAARRLPLSIIGLFQYIAPSLSLLLAVGIYGEPFRRPQAEAFACIWLALALIGWDSWTGRRAAASRRDAPGAPAPARAALSGDAVGGGGS